MAHVHMTQKNSIVDQVEQVQQHIARRAYDLFLERGGSWGNPWTDWLAAEVELVRRPAVELREKDGAYTVSASLAGLDPQDIQIDITPDDLVVKSDAARSAAAQDGDVHLSELRRGRVFRSIHFPKPVDMAKARAEYRNGLLIVSAPIALESRARRLDMKVA